MTVMSGSLGGSYLDAGYVYAPYVPLQVTPAIMVEQPPLPWQRSTDMFLGGYEGEWSSRSLNKVHKEEPYLIGSGSIMTRYGKKNVQKSYYGVVTVMNLPTGSVI